MPRTECLRLAASSLPLTDQLLIQRPSMIMPHLQRYIIAWQGLRGQLLKSLDYGRSYSDRQTLSDFADERYGPDAQALLAEATMFRYWHAHARMATGSLAFAFRTSSLPTPGGNAWREACCAGCRGRKLVGKHRISHFAGSR